MNPAEPRAKLLDRPDLDAEYLKLFRAVLRDGREDVARRALHRAILCGPRFGRPYEVFGSALCRGFGNTGRVVDGQQPMATTETKAPIFVFGSSHARSFSDRDRFAPFMMGSANHVCFLTEELAKRTTGIVDEHLARTPEGGTAILVLSNCDCITLDNELEAEVEAEIAGDEAARENQLVAGTLRFGLALA